MSSAAEIIKSLVEQTQAQLNKEPTETHIMTLAFTLVPKIEQLAKGQLKGPEKMEVLLGTLDALLNMCNQETAGPLRASLKDRIVPAVSGLINATHTGDISLGIASAVALTTEVIAVASKGCWCFGRGARSALPVPVPVPVPAPAPAPVPVTATVVELPPLPASPSKEIEESN
jgi:hypothetical protein